MNTSYEKNLQDIKERARYLKLAYSFSNARDFIDEHISGGSGVDECYAELMKRESNVREENGKQNRIRSANFPYKKYLSDLQAEFLPDDAKEKLGALKTLEFIRNGQNLILAGNPGTGKTHIAIGLGIQACLEGFKVLFCGAPNLINRLKEARSERTLLTLQRQFEGYDMVIIDELGYISFDKEGGELLFTHLSLRAERKSTLITTNLSFEKWEDIFKDPVMTTAIIDRITHKAFAVNMNGNSYRLMETQKFMKFKS
jgi:DNA replication protein DnaC